MNVTNSLVNETLNIFLMVLKQELLFFTNEQKKYNPLCIIKYKYMIILIVWFY